MRKLTQPLPGKLTQKSRLRVKPRRALTESVVRRQSLPGLLYIQEYSGHPQPSLSQPGSWWGPTIVWGLLVNIILQA